MHLISEFCLHSELMQLPSRDDIVSVVVVAAGDRALVQWSTLTVDIIG